MTRKATVDVPKLFELWEDRRLTRTEVARGLGLTDKQLTAVAARYGLGLRGQTNRCVTPGDPTADQIAERAREMREKHYAQRRAESEEVTRKRLWQEGVRDTA